MEYLISQLQWPYDSPTPYPHSLTSISLLVSPQQIRKASQHLHGDGPQPSRWPQCAARQLKRERRAGKRKWVRIRGSRAGNVKLPPPRACARPCALSNTHTHTQTNTRVCSCLSARLPGSSQRKQIATPRQAQSVSSGGMKRGGGGC